MSSVSNRCTPDSACIDEAASVLRRKPDCGSLITATEALGACQRRSWSHCKALLMGSVVVEDKAFVMRLCAAAWANDVVGLQQLWGGRSRAGSWLRGLVMECAVAAGSVETLEWGGAQARRMRPCGLATRPSVWQQQRNGADAV